MNKYKPERKRLRLAHFNYASPNHVYFLSLCANSRRLPFDNPDLAKGIIGSLNYQREKNQIKLFCYCLMPDHLHLLLSPGVGIDIPEVIKRFKTFTTTLSWKFDFKGKLWQRSYYDHIIRKQEELLKVCEYILDNPVKRVWLKNKVVGPIQACRIYYRDNDPYCHMTCSAAV